MCVGREGLVGGEQSNTMVTMVTSVSPVRAEESHLSETVVKPFRPDSSVQKGFQGRLAPVCVCVNGGYASVTFAHQCRPSHNKVLALLVGH